MNVHGNAVLLTLKVRHDRHVSTHGILTTLHGGGSEIFMGDDNADSLKFVAVHGEP